MRPRITLLVTDLDNTLYDWVTSFTTAFYEMVDVAVCILDVDREHLLDELRAVHRRRRNSEEPFALLETGTVRRTMAGLTREEQAERLDEAFHAFNSARKRTLILYPGVMETLERLNEVGVTVVAHTEATVTNAQFRLAKLGIAKFMQRLYALEHAGEPHPRPARRETICNVPQVILLREDERKPDPRILLDICRNMRATPERTLYVGDSIPSDVGMAKQAGVWAAWAEYGTRFDPACWERLVRVTHWVEEDVKRARASKVRFGDVRPDAVLHSFGDLLRFFDFSARGS